MSKGGPVVSDAGPLVALAKLNLLHLLTELYGRVYFARSVYDEAVIEGMRLGHEDARKDDAPFPGPDGLAPREYGRRRLPD